MIQDPVFVAAAVVIVLTASFVTLFSHLRRSGKNAVSTASRNPVRFHPMGRLLNEADFEFLSRQPGYYPQLGAELRNRRVEIFRSYLDSLAEEFHHLHRKLRILSLYAPVDRADLSRLLVEQRLLFGLRLFQVRFRLIFFRFGVKPVDVTGLVNVVEEMRRQVALMTEGLSPAPAPVAA